MNFSTSLRTLTRAVVPSTRLFSTSAARPVASTSSLQSRPSEAEEDSSPVSKVLNLMAQAGAEAPEETTKDPASLMRNLDGLRVISPGHLTPKYLLNPRLPRPDYTLAHPLGPPVSAATKHDPFARLEISPLDSPMNPFLRSEFVTSMGKIKGRGKTGLQRGNQRKMGKAVRRARAMGVIPAVGQSVPGGRVDY